ncbi:uncharacterized protein LOC126981503 isoform X2 [Eriocheir sinensis]|nr:uncharacterized protein LOC126981503 isoform X2 [Eriocheir sinensis]
MGIAVCLMLWVAAAAALAVVRNMRFAPWLNSVQDDEDDGSKTHTMSEADQRKVWPQTAVLLPALANHYPVHHLTVHQPHSYETQDRRQTWHFRPFQGHLMKQAHADIILHTDAVGLRLTLKHSKSPTATQPSYTLSLTNTTALKSHVEDLANILVPQNISHLKQNSLPNVNKMLHGTWTVVDVTEYLQDWLFVGSDLWVEVVALHRLQEDAGRGYPVLQLQPTVCVWDDQGDEDAAKSGDHLKTALKVFLETKMQERAAGRLWPDSEQHGEDETEAPRQRNKRETPNSLCKVQWVEVSKQELGLGLVLFPNTLILKYCDGSCHILDHSDIFSTNALFRAKYKFLRESASMPSPQCIPTNFNHQQFFVWDTNHNNIKMIKVWDLDAEKCGCR